MKTKIAQFAKAGLVGVALFGFALTAGATGTWTAPTGTAPAGNVDAPINVGSTAQTKIGNYAVSGNFAAWGNTTLGGHVDIGVDACYNAAGGACTGGVGGASLPQYFGLAKPKSVFASVAKSISGFFSTATAYAINTPSTDALHVYGNATFAGGDVWINMSPVCTTGNGNCGWKTSGLDIYNGNSGRVGIGTSTPQYELDLNGTTNIGLGNWCELTPTDISAGQTDCPSGAYMYGLASGPSIKGKCRFFTPSATPVDMGDCYVHAPPPALGVTITSAAFQEIPCSVDISTLSANATGGYGYYTYQWYYATDSSATKSNTASGWTAGGTSQTGGVSAYMTLAGDTPLHYHAYVKVTDLAGGTVKSAVWNTIPSMRGPTCTQ